MSRRRPPLWLQAQIRPSRPPTSTPPQPGRRANRRAHGRLAARSSTLHQCSQRRSHAQSIRASTLSQAVHACILRSSASYQHLQLQHTALSPCQPDRGLCSLSVQTWRHTSHAARQQLAQSRVYAHQFRSTHSPLSVQVPGIASWHRPSQRDPRRCYPSFPAHN